MIQRIHLSVMSGESTSAPRRFTNRPGRTGTVARAVVRVRGPWPRVVVGKDLARTRGPAWGILRPPATYRRPRHKGAMFRSPSHEREVSGGAFPSAPGPAPSRL